MPYTGSRLFKDIVWQIFRILSVYWHNKWVHAIFFVESQGKLNHIINVWHSCILSAGTEVRIMSILTSSTYHKSFNYENNFVALTVKKNCKIKIQSNNKPNWPKFTNIFEAYKFPFIPFTTFMLVIKFVQYEHS